MAASTARANPANLTNLTNLPDHPPHPPASSGSPLPPTIPGSLRDRIPKLEPRRRSQPAANPTPPPETPPLPPPVSAADAADWSKHVFATPHRRILSKQDHELFLASPTCRLLQAWVFGLADAVVDTPAGVFTEALEEWKTSRKEESSFSDPPASSTHRRPQLPPQRPLSPVILSLLAILDDAETLLDACPPDETGGSRFGNKRFRAFVDLVRQRAPVWHRERLGLSGEEHAAAVAEASVYLGQSFGNRARIDYGSGHELHFVVWLLCLYELGVVHVGASTSDVSSSDDRAALVLVVFSRYLELMRRVQTTYYLEPAGSHGVWGLDDYQFLPFLFGAAQLLGHRFITPRAVHQPLTLEQFGDDYLYLGQVRFVNSIKIATGGRPTPSVSEKTASTAPTSTTTSSSKSSSKSADNSLRWHSPMLDDISASRSWSKIEGGMRRMFVAEVLRKLPVMQHFLFGSLVPPASGMTVPPENHDNDANADSDSDSDDALADGNDVVDVFDKGGVRHIHNPSGWGDCCGIRVPSSFGAAGEMRKRGGDVLRRIPFD